MADIVINGNTHKNIDYVRIKRSDGTTATFFDSKNRDKRDVVVGIEANTHMDSIAVVPKFKSITVRISKEA